MAVAFISGASTGIGLETAILIARRGCRYTPAHGGRRARLVCAIDEGLPIGRSYSTSIATSPFALPSRVLRPAIVQRPSSGYHS